MKITTSFSKIIIQVFQKCLPFYRDPVNNCSDPQHCLSLKKRVRIRNPRIGTYTDVPVGHHERICKKKKNTSNNADKRLEHVNVLYVGLSISCLLLVSQNMKTIRYETENVLPSFACFAN